MPGAGGIAIACLWSMAYCLPQFGWRQRCRAGPGWHARGVDPGTVLILPHVPMRWLLYRRRRGSVGD